MNVLRRVWGVVGIEGLLFLILAIYVRVNAEGIPESVWLFPLGVLSTGLVLSWRFRRSRLLYGLLVLGLAHGGVFLAGGVTAMPDPTRHAIAVLLPLNLLALTLVIERGTFTPVGLLRFGVIVIQVPLVAWAFDADPVPLAGLLDLAVFPRGWFGWTRLAQPALALVLAAALVLGARLVMRANATGRGFLWAMLAATAAVGSATGEPATTLYFSTAGLILIVAVIEASYFMAYRDGLTGLPARRALNEELLRLTGQYTVAMVDIDHFKKFNDTHGHHVGDQVLRMVATHLDEVGGGGRAYRYGGEEFALIFPGKETDEVKPYLERLRSAIADAAFTLRGPGRPKEKPTEPVPDRGPRKKASVTISIGAAHRTDRRSAPSEVIGFADKALYQAKKGGRNRVRIWRRRGAA